MPKDTDTKKDPMVEYVVKEFEAYEAIHRPRMEVAKEIYTHWNNEKAPKGQDWQNTVPVPLMIEAEQTITPRIFAALFPSDTPIDVKVEGDAEEGPEVGIKLKALLAKNFKAANVQKESIPMLGQMTLYGTGYCEAGTWKVKRKWIDTKEAGRQFLITESRPDAKWVNFFEMYPHPAKMEVGDGLPIIRRRFIDEEFLKNLANDRYTFKNLMEALKSTSPMTGDTKYIKPSDSENCETFKKNEYEILEYWGNWDESYTVGEEVKKRLSVPYWIIVVNRTILVRGIPNPYNHQMEPYCKTKLFTDLKPSWFGVGIGRAGLPSQARANKIVNQRLDNVDLILNKQGLYNINDPNINLSRLKTTRPGQWHPVSDVTSSIKWMDIPDVTASSYEEEKIAKQDFREATGATSHLLPTAEGDKAHRTAMGIQLLQGAAGMRFRPVLKLLEIDFIAHLTFLFFSNLQQFMATPETVIDEETQAMLEIKPEELQGKVHFIPTGISETLNKEIQIGQLLRFKEVTANDPTVNRKEINKRLGELFGFKDLTSLLTPDVPGGGQGDALDPNVQQLIQQRLQEGASPEQIKQELLGQRPPEEEEEVQQ